MSGGGGGGDDDGKDGGVAPEQVVEALLFAAFEPLPLKRIQAHLGDLGDAEAALETLAAAYAKRGVRLERVGEGWAFRTAPEAAPYLVRPDHRPRRLSKAAMETLAVIAWQGPVTRAEIEAVRGVPVAKGTLDVLIESGFVAPKGRREAPGRPVTWAATQAFLDHFGLASLGDLPRLEELRAAGLLKEE